MLRITQQGEVGEDTTVNHENTTRPMNSLIGGC
jgi:hypothetical protein